jgi:Uma2 family endonuclease
MSAVLKLNWVSVEDYLAGELASETKHEYVDGQVFAMAGARNLHNIIGGNVHAFLHHRLRGKPCRPFNSDTKIHIQTEGKIRFYYPEVSVICRQNPLDDSFQDEPVVVFEVLSKKTRHKDEGEKKDAYLTIPSLMAYVLLEQDFPSALVHRRTNAGFVSEVYRGLDAVLSFPEIGTELPLSEVYEGVEFIPEEDDDETA